ncbi:GTPase IMAP family member 7-like [Myripristis murdjan]|uniref:GTPase IMAP family member 7-like n=1 Tax=Myripristis murdjan TaxID=586833 RepID=UPI00117623BC|nr:GTPase IMAP family member 7-like [Myripristis murdjan]
MSDTRRIVLLGETRAGKSSLANTIFGETVFETASSPNSQTSICKAESRSVNGRSITLIDTPGFVDTEKTEEQLKKEMLKCVLECAPGPHAFLIVLKVERYTDQEEVIVRQISQYFSAEAFRYAAVVFTHGDQLDEEMKIHDFVNQSEGLSDLVKKCGGRCHVIDNKYWWNNQQDPYRSNQFQVAQLLCTIDEIIEQNNGGCYTNELLEAAEREIQKEEERIRQSSRNMSEIEIREKTEISALKRLCHIQ